MREISALSCRKAEYSAAGDDSCQSLEGAKCLCSSLISLRRAADFPILPNGSAVKALNSELHLAASERQPLAIAAAAIPPLSSTPSVGK